jgi:hypothetical protein
MKQEERSGKEVEERSGKEVEWKPKLSNGTTERGGNG